MAAATTESVAESSVIESLGPLFKITEVFLWDDPVISMPKAASDHLDNLIDERATSCTTADINSNINTIDGNTSWEDFELAKQMDALGLPISFSSTKQRNSMAIKGKRKEIRAKPLSANKDTENSITRASKGCLLEDNSSSNVLHDSINICCKNTEDGPGATYHDVYDGQGRGVSPLDRIKDSLCLTATIPGNFVEKHSCNDETGVIMSNCVEDQLSSRDSDMEMGAVLENILSSDPENFPRNDLEDVKLGTHQEEELFHKHVLDSHVGDSSISCYIAGENNVDDGKKNVNSHPTSMESSLSCASADHHVPDYSDNSVCYEFGDWRVIWDPFYKRNYFYNFQSQESTWYPPPGLEHFALCPSVSNSNESSNITAEEHTSIEVACDAMQDIYLHDSHNGSSLFHKKEDGVEYLNLSSAEIISSRLDDDITANFVSSHSDEFTIVKKTVYEEVLLHTPTDRSTGEHDVNGYWEKQENGITSEACTAADVPLELLVSNSLASTVNEGVNGEDGNNSSNTGVISSVDELDNYHGIFSKKKKQRVRRLQSQLAFQEVDGRLPDSLIKYWYQRYLLFSQFDNGIKMDEEGWFSVTPESIARHHASRCGCGIIIDCFTGVGGNAIQFAMKRNHVIAIDIDPQKIDFAQHNAAIYGVSDQINFIVGDFFQIAPHLKGDVIFLSPPWGGPDYNKVQAYDITTMLKPHDGKYLFEIARTIASKVVMFLPRNADLDQLAELSLSVNPPWAVEVEKNFLNGRLKAITAYFDNPVL